MSLTEETLLNIGLLEKYLNDNDVPSLKEALTKAPNMPFDCFKLLVINGADDYVDAIYPAAERLRVDIISYCFDHFKDNAEKFKCIVVFSSYANASILNMGLFRSSDYLNQLCLIGMASRFNNQKLINLITSDQPLDESAKLMYNLVQAEIDGAVDVTNNFEYLFYSMLRHGGKNNLSFYRSNAVNKTDWNYPLLSINFANAILNGHMDLQMFEQFYELIIKCDLNIMLKMAASRGQFALCKRLLDAGAVDKEAAAKLAEEANHKRLAVFLRKE